MLPFAFFVSTTIIVACVVGFLLAKKGFFFIEKILTVYNETSDDVTIYFQDGSTANISIGGYETIKLRVTDSISISNSVVYQLKNPDTKNIYVFADGFGDDSDSYMLTVDNTSASAYNLYISISENVDSAAIIPSVPGNSTIQMMTREGQILVIGIGSFSTAPFLAKMPGEQANKLTISDAGLFLSSA